MSVLFLKNMLPQLNAYANTRTIACFFLNKENISYSDQGILYRKYWEEYYTLCEDVIVEKKVACDNFDDSS